MGPGGGGLLPLSLGEIPPLTAPWRVGWGSAVSAPLYLLWSDLAADPPRPGRRRETLNVTWCVIMAAEETCLEVQASVGSIPYFFLRRPSVAVEAFLLWW